MSILAGAEPFFLPGGDHGVIVVHGFTGSPSEMRPLGEYLQAQGFTVLGPRLCGHGTCVQELNQTKWPQWYTSVEDAFFLLRGVCRTVSVVGLSMGGLMALKLGTEYPVARVVTLSAPIYINDKRLAYLPLIRLFRRYSPKRRRRYNAGDQYSVGYDQFPLAAVSSLLELIKHISQQLPQLKVPLLVVQSRNEHTVIPQSAQYIYDRAGSREKELLWLDKSGHVVTLDVERYMLFEKITAFLRGADENGRR